MLTLQEFKTILDFKRGRNDQLGEDLEPWDEAYLTRMMKSSAHNLDYSVSLFFNNLITCVTVLSSNFAYVISLNLSTRYLKLSHAFGYDLLTLLICIMLIILQLSDAKSILPEYPIQNLSFLGHHIAQYTNSI